jgi:hypothetical protein
MPALPEIMKKISYVIISIYLLIAVLNLANADSDDQEVYQLGEISVTPGRFSISESTPSPYFMTRDEMEKLPLIDNDIYRAAHNLPGVVADDFSARFSLRGGDRDETVIRLDGMELYDPYHLQDFGGAISVIDMGIVRSADLLTGGFPAEYGDAMSGVFDVTSRKVNREKMAGNVGLDIVNTSLMLEAPIRLGTQNSLPVLLSARRGYIDLLMGLINSEEIIKPVYYDLYSKISYDIKPSDKISAHILYARDSDEIDRVGLDNDIDSRYWNGLYWAKWNHLMTEKMLWNLYLFSGRAGRDKYEGVDGVDERQLSYTGFKGDFLYNPISSQILKAGWRWQNSSAEYKYFLNDDGMITSVEADPSGWILNGYVQDEWKATEFLAGNLGLRYIYQSYGDNSAVMPRVAVAAKPWRNLVVRGAWGLYHQPVQVINLPVEEGIAESRPMEKAYHYVLASEYSSAVGSSGSIPMILRVETYYKTFNDLAGRIRDYGRKEQVFTSPDSGSARGIEFFLSLRQLPLPFAERRLSSFSIAYALSKSEVETEAGTVPRDYDRRHSLSLNANYEVWSDGWLSITWRYHTGDPYTEAWYEKVLNADGSSYIWQKKYGELNGMRYPSYHSLDARLTKNFHFRRWNLSLYLQIMNLYNRQNIQEYSFEQMTDDKGEIFYERIDEHFLPILPTLGLSAQF